MPSQPQPVTAATREFDAICHHLLQQFPRADVQVEQIPAPRNLAPHALALQATLTPAAASGRLILLHDPKGHPAWNGQFRLVTYLEADVEHCMARDELLPQVGWSWLLDALDSRSLGKTALNATVTQMISTAFDDVPSPTAVVAEPELDGSAQVEIRASWTPLLLPQQNWAQQLSQHLQAWYQLLRLCAGLPAQAEVSYLHKDR